MTTRAITRASVVAWLAWMVMTPVHGAATQRITLRTDDGMLLGATWYEPSSRPAPAVILVHMLHRSRRDWDSLAHRLAGDGIGALALDLRGHGESQRFALPDVGSDSGYAAMLLDVKAARRYLATRSDVQQSRIGIAGASIGANLAVLAGSADSSVVSLALLSPSLDYRGLRIEAVVRKLRSPILLVAGTDDAYAARSVRELQKAGGGERQVLMLDRAGHGTVMLSRDENLPRTLVDWFRRTLL